MFRIASLSLLLAAGAFAAPEPLMERGGAVNCKAVNSIVTIMKQQAVATPFCSSYLKIPHPTITTTITSTPMATTTTTTITKSTDTVTTTVVSWKSTVTTVYPVVAISTTSTCALSATVIQSAYANNKRGVTTTTTKCSTTSTPAASKPPLGIPTCLTKYIQADVSSACNCLSIPTQTYTSTISTTLTTATITSTVCSVAKTTTTVTTTSTTFTSTYSGTQYYTSTFTVLPPPSSTIAPPANPTQTFGAYASLDFSGQDIQNFFCYANGPAAPAPFEGTTCASFNDCVNECAYYNANSLGASTNTTCGAVVYNSPPDGSSGSCYLKTGVQGCGGTNSMTNTGVLLPLIATDPQ